MLQVSELLPLLREPEVVSELRRQLGLPPEPVLTTFADLRQMFRETDARMEASRRETDQQFRETDARLARESAELREQHRETDVFLTRLARESAELREALRETDALLRRLAAETRAEMHELGEHARRRDEELARQRTELGSFSQSIGQWVEDAVLYDVPGYLQRRRGLTVQGLERGSLPRHDGLTEQIDAIGRARGPAGDVLVVVEAKNRVREREVRAFAVKLGRVTVDEPLLAMLVGHMVEPAAAAVGEELGILVVSTLGLRWLG